MNMYCKIMIDINKLNLFFDFYLSATSVVNRLDTGLA